MSGSWWADPARSKAGHRGSRLTRRTYFERVASAWLTASSGSSLNNGLLDLDRSQEFVGFRTLADNSANLTPASEASGPHDFAVRKHAPWSEAPPASIASRPASVTIAIRPSMRQDGWRYGFDLGEARRGIFLQMGLDGWNRVEPKGEFFLQRNSGLSTDGS
jgi:hypothetical protein